MAGNGGSGGVKKAVRHGRPAVQLHSGPQRKKVESRDGIIRQRRIESGASKPLIGDERKQGTELKKKRETPFVKGRGGTLFP